MAYPPGLSTIEVVLTLDAIGGKYARGQYRVESERTFGYAGSPWVMQMVVRPNTLLAEGEARIRLPHTNQAGLIGDNGSSLTYEPAYKISVMPSGSVEFGNSKYFRLPVSLGVDTVNLNTLTDLGGWPNQTVIVTAPGGGGGAWVPVTVAGSTTGAWRWQPA